MTEDAATEDANIVSEGTVDTTDLLRRFADELDFRRGSDSDETQRARFLAELATGGHLSDTGKAHATPRATILRRQSKRRFDASPRIWFTPEGSWSAHDFAMESRTPR